MAAPVIGRVLASLAVDAVTSARPPTGAPPPPKRGSGLVWLIAGVLGLLLLVPALIVAVLFGGAQRADCAPGEPLAGSWTGPGSLGGVAGTGVTAAELRAARRIKGVGGTRVTAGTYSPTAYFPHPKAPKTNCAATCTSTASGIRVDNATRRAYLIASNPALNQYGALAYVWPNPYGWPGPFVVADTGSAFTGPGRLDFYIFISTRESWQHALARAYHWGPATKVSVSATPIAPGAPSITTPVTEAGLASAGGGCVVAVDGELGARIAQIAARHVGAGPSIPGFQPPTTGLAWCAWFASNVWRQAGVGIDVTFFSAAPYSYGLAHGTLFKAPGRPPRGTRPPLGAALMYGTGPQSTSTSVHVNLVSKLNADGSFMTIGGNESGRVRLSGPCRLSAAGPITRLHGPGCDSRPVYAISAPGALT